MLICLEKLYKLSLILEDATVITVKTKDLYMHLN